MSRNDDDLWPWFLATGLLVGGGLFVAWASSQNTTGKAAPLPQLPQQPKPSAIRTGPIKVAPKASPAPPASRTKPAPAPQKAPQAGLGTPPELDVEAAARMLASENPRGSERLHVEQIWTQLRSRRRGQSLYDRITAGSGWGEQAHRKPPGRVRPVATTEPASPAFRGLAREVLLGLRPSTLPGARKYFEPAQQDRAFAIAETARKKRAAGEVLSSQELRLIRYHMDAKHKRAEWLQTSRFVDVIDGVEFFT